MIIQGISLNQVNLLKFSLLSIYASLVCQLINVQVVANECGTADFPRGLKVVRNQTMKGVWPFAAVLYEVKESRFFCGGTLITNKHVLTGILFPSEFVSFT